MSPFIPKFSHNHSVAPSPIFLCTHNSKSKQDHTGTSTNTMYYILFLHGMEEI